MPTWPSVQAGTFDISHVITGIHNKMVRRHPHVPSET